MIFEVKIMNFLPAMNIQRIDDDIINKLLENQKIKSEKILIIYDMYCNFNNPNKYLSDVLINNKQYNISNIIVQPIDYCPKSTINIFDYIGFVKDNFASKIKRIYHNYKTNITDFKLFLKIYFHYTNEYASIWFVNDENNTEIRKLNYFRSLKIEYKNDTTSEYCKYFKINKLEYLDKLMEDKEKNKIDDERDRWLYTKNTIDPFDTIDTDDKTNKYKLLEKIIDANMSIIKLLDK